MDTLLGLSISDESVEVVEVMHDGHALSVRAIGEWKRTGEADFPALGDRLRSFVQANAIRANNVTIALDGGLLFVQTFPVEIGLSREEWDRHAQWERSQFFPKMSGEEFIGDVFPLPPRPTQTSQEILSVSIRRENVRALRKMVHHAGLELGGVDGAHFCAETLLLERSQELSDQPTLFVTLKKQSVEWSLYEEKTLVHYGARRAGGSTAIAEVLGTVLKNSQPDRILMHGPLAGQETQGVLRDATHLPVHTFDPFLTVNLPADLPLAEHFTATSFRFAAAVGAALRAAGAD